MACLFQYRAKNEKAEDVSGTIEALGQDEAIEQLRGEGWVIIDLKKEKT